MTETDVLLVLNRVTETHSLFQNLLCEEEFPSRSLTFVESNFRELLSSLYKLANEIYKEKWND